MPVAAKSEITSAALRYFPNPLIEPPKREDPLEFGALRFSEFVSEGYYVGGLFAKLTAAGIPGILGTDT